jgi:hypothetical protein
VGDIPANPADIQPIIEFYKKPYTCNFDSFSTMDRYLSVGKWLSELFLLPSCGVLLSKKKK